MKQTIKFLFLAIVLGTISLQSFAVSTLSYSWTKVTGTYTFPSVSLNSDYNSVSYTINSVNGTTIVLNGTGYKSSSSYTGKVTIYVDGTTVQTTTLTTSSSTIYYSKTFTDETSHVIKVSTYNATYDKATLSSVTVTQPSNVTNLDVTLTDAGDLQYYITDNNKYQIKSLTLAGPVNGADIKIVRDLLQSDKAELCSLNFKNVRFVTGGGSCGTHYYEWSGSYGDYDDPTETYTGNDVITDGLFYGCTNLTDIVLPDSVTAINYRGFYFCENLQTVVMGNSITSIGESAFNRCYSLNNVKMSSNITEIGDYAFSGCKLTSVSLPSNLKTIGSHAFSGCSALTTVSFPSTIESVSDDAFYGCTSINKVNIASLSSWCAIDFSSASANPIYYSKKFNIDDSNSPITALSIPDNVTKIGSYCFANCTGLTSLSIPTSVISIGSGAFSCCSSLSSLTIQEGVTQIGSKCFEQCTSLQSVAFPTSLTSIGGGAFDGCTGLTKVSTPSLSSWCSINFAVNYESEDVYDSSGNVAEDTNGDWDWNVTKTNTYYKSNPLYYAHNLYVNEDKVTDLVIPSDIQKIGTGAFAYCTSLTSVEFPSSVTNVGTMAFWHCSNISTVKVANKSAWNDIVFSSASYEYGVDLGEKDEDGYYSSNKGLYTTDYSSNPIYASCTSSITDFANLSWSSNDESIATVTSAGVINVTGVGTTMIIVSASSTRNFCNFVVSGDKTLAQSITLSASSCELKEGETKQLTATVLPEATDDKTITWSSSDESIATIDATGLITATGIGSTTITATATDGSNVSATCGIHVVANNDAAIAELQKLVDDAQTLYDNSTEGEDIGQYKSGARAALLAVINSVKAQISSTMDESTITSCTSDINNAVAVFNSNKIIVEEDTDLASYDNIVYIDKAEAIVGQQVTLSLKMNNTIAPTGFQCDVYLPSGVEAAKDGDGFYLASLSTERTTTQKTNYFDSALQLDGALRVMCSSTKNYTFSGNDGEVATITVNIADTIEDGTYPLILKNIVISDANSKTYKVDYVKTTLTITSYTLGDANNDKEINVGDFTAIASKIMGNPPATFVEKAADVNVDGEINVGDLTGVANLVLYGTVTPSSSAKVATAKTYNPTTLNISDCNITPGNEFTIGIDINGGVAFSGYQFDMILPKGISVKMNGEEPDTWLSTSRTNAKQTDLFTSGLVNGNTVRLLSASSKGYIFEGTEGTVAYITLIADKDITEGDYVVNVNNIVVSANGNTVIPENTKFIAHIVGTTAITDVMSVNGDNSVYDLSGKAIMKSGSFERLNKGIYIINGKKIVK